MRSDRLHTVCSQIKVLSHRSQLLGEVVPLTPLLRWVFLLFQSIAETPIYPYVSVRDKGEPMRKQGSDAALKTHLCSFCSRGFARRYDCLRHERSHTGERPYPCHLCDMRFAVKPNLHRHIETVHNKMDRRTQIAEILAATLKPHHEAA